MQSMNKNKYASLIVATILFATAGAQAGIIVGGTRVIYNGDKKEASISVKNPDKSSYLIQSWSDTGEKNSEKSPFMVTPPLFRLGAGLENTLRIIRTGGNLPEDRESLYWMNIKSIPSTTEKQDNINTLQIAVKTRIKLIYRPQSLTEQPENVTGKLTWQRSGNHLTVNNPTAYYMNFSTVKVGTSPVKDATYVAPMGSASFTFPTGASGDVTWTLINDFGSIGAEHRSQL
ncbi:molecular chaperone [Salmonella enterica subsp. enterica]|uniref:Long polar fimbrial chaperone LpfB n=2 Tax=Salmonella enterica TaxID=28901 RepID=A0A2C9P167_SALET|nr:long polar fimbrial chaperone LpfB [Salmonella enterica subsp. enterica serovar Macclesfield str. S-1643]EAA5488853.1 molecular chaperone [Salmonella enterica subsp. enterica serovar Kouka]EAC1130749.1 molecular chaperone [Salmonella enterica subsp. enterica serovar Kambole]EBG2395040.1 molecular chaperone [Salmonella enterica subsp. enterica serovar Everleigh]EBS1107715.1 molecular chaperone [Salmonella enterica subsp. enterica serovar Eingedi]EBV2191431.1 molecular chaperone [Salmonella e